MISKTLLAITLCVLIQVSFQVVLDDPTVPQIVIETMGSRIMRYHHFLWHNVRENWLNLQASTQHALMRYGWAPPRPAAFYKDNGDQIVLEDNDSGEDFLYMHRQMVQQVNQLVAGTAYGKVTGWKVFPIPGDPKWPIPPTYDTGDSGFNDLLVQVKSDDFYWNTIQPFEEQITDPDYLRTITLGQMGSKIEFYIHKWMHLRFSERTEIGLRATTANPTPNIDTKWDDLSYRWLGDTYSSHVNPIFWRIHGWVDNMIEEWRKANGLTTITWKGTWISGPWSVLEDLFVAGDVVDSDSDDTPGTGTGDGDTYQPPAEVISAMTQVVALMLQLDTHNYFRNTNTTNPLP